MKNSSHENVAALICSHCAEGLPILIAARDEPTGDDDSGWQFFCNSGQIESIEDAKVWSLYEVLKKETSLASYVDSIPGSVLRRDSCRSGWIIDFQPR